MNPQKPAETASLAPECSCLPRPAAAPCLSPLAFVLPCSILFYNFFRVEARAVFLHLPGKKINRLAALHRDNHIGIYRPGMIEIILRGNARILRMRMIEADYIQLLLTRVAFAPQQLRGFDQETPPARLFFAGVGDGKELNQGLAPVGFKVAEQEPATLIGILPFTQAADLVDMLLAHTDHFLLAPAAPVAVPKCFSTEASA